MAAAAAASSSSSSSLEKMDIWIEKYRPRTLEEVEGSDATMQRLRAIAREGNMPNLLLSVGAGGIDGVIDYARLGEHALQRLLKVYRVSKHRLFDMAPQTRRSGKLSVAMQRTGNRTASCTHRRTWADK
eukprot:GHVU01234171.1.p1 GENE.GHVU01234171.1~~GHVU01234171.1.p1  ORF type:complete len:129 (-),score=12.49 GHVU01234171.1:565-951(-)